MTKIHRAPPFNNEEEIKRRNALKKRGQVLRTPQSEIPEELSAREAAFGAVDVLNKLTNAKLKRATSKVDKYFARMEVVAECALHSSDRSLGAAKVLLSLVRVFITDGEFVTDSTLVPKDKEIEIFFEFCRLFLETLTKLRKSLQSGDTESALMCAIVLAELQQTFGDDSKGVFVLMQRQIDDYRRSVNAGKKAGGKRKEARKPEWDGWEKEIARQKEKRPNLEERSIARIVAGKFPGTSQNTIRYHMRNRMK